MATPVATGQIQKQFQLDHRLLDRTWRPSQILQRSASDKIQTATQARIVTAFENFVVQKLRTLVTYVRQGTQNMSSSMNHPIYDQKPPCVFVERDIAIKSPSGPPSPHGLDVMQQGHHPAIHAHEQNGGPNRRRHCRRSRQRNDMMALAKRCNAVSAKVCIENGDANHYKMKNKFLPEVSRVNPHFVPNALLRGGGRAMLLLRVDVFFNLLQYFGCVGIAKPDRRIRVFKTFTRGLNIIIILLAA